MTVINLLADGKKHSRKELANALGVADRTMRRLIEDARCEGYAILNDQDGTGYYLETDRQALLRYYRQEWARAMSILVRLKYIRRTLKEEDLL